MTAYSMATRASCIAIKRRVRRETSATRRSVSLENNLHAVVRTASSLLHALPRLLRALHHEVGPKRPKPLPQGRQRVFQEVDVRRQRSPGLRRALVAALALIGIGLGAMVATGLGLGRMLTQIGARGGNNMAIPSNPTTLTGKAAT